MLATTADTELAMTDSDQREVIAFLSDRRSYDPKPDRVEIVETHGALVFLAGAYAYKIKRAVRFPYMDFSTLEKRHSVCRREIEINKHPRLQTSISTSCPSRGRRIARLRSAVRAGQ